MKCARGRGDGGWIASGPSFGGKGRNNCRGGWMLSGTKVPRCRNRLTLLSQLPSFTSSDIQIDYFYALSLTNFGAKVKTNPASPPSQRNYAQGHVAGEGREIHGAGSGGDGHGKGI